jgi:two-component system chemotaxis response regulator CheB
VNVTAAAEAASPEARPARRVVVVGASAGGVEAVSTVLAGLPRELGAAVVVVLHIGARAPSMLAQVLGRRSELPTREARDGEPLVEGTVYVAPPDRHVVVAHDRLRIVAGPKENGHRPAIDPLFRSAALEYGSAATAVVLSGMLDDGSTGAAVVSDRGGQVIVQDPVDALFAEMPESAIWADHPQHVLPLEEIAPAIVRTVSEEPEKAAGAAGELSTESLETRFSLLDEDVLESGGVGEPSPYGCPACGGVLNEVPDESILRFRCRVGHAYGVESLRETQRTGVEAALWAALRALEERADLSRRMARRLRRGGFDDRAVRHEREADDDQVQARLVRDLLAGHASSGKL